MDISQNNNKTINILLFGENGNGKSTLGNALLGFDAFDTSYRSKQPVGKKGIGERANLFVIESHGFQDPTGMDKYYIIDFLTYIKEKKELNAILLVFNYQQTRFPYNIQIMLKIFCDFFSLNEIGNHIGFIFTNAFTRKGPLTTKEKNLKLEKKLPEFIRIIEEISKSKISNNIFSGFVDIDSIEGIDENGKKNLERIIEWASSLSNLNIQTNKDFVSVFKIATQDLEEKLKIQEDNQKEIKEK